MQKPNFPIEIPVFSANLTNVKSMYSDKKTTNCAAKLGTR